MRTKYLYEEDIPQYLDIQDYQNYGDPSITVVDNGVILPALFDPDLPWGKGGVLDEFGNFVEESKLDDSFGGKYEFDSSDVDEINESVVCISVLPKHWGHFLIDVLCKLWFVIDHKEKRYKIAYCSLDWKNTNGLTGVFSQTMELAGIEKEQLIYITKPTRCKQVILPERTLGFSHNWNTKYMDVINIIVRNACEKAKKKKSEVL